MKFGLRTPSINKRIAARTSVKRYVRHNLGFKAPRGMGWLTNPKKAAYNRVYNRTSFSSGKGLEGLIIFLVFGIIIFIFQLIFSIISEIFDSESAKKSSSECADNLGVSPQFSTVPLMNTDTSCPRCSSAMVKRMAKRGPNKGNEFWGCSRFPRCKGTRN